MLTAGGGGRGRSWKCVPIYAAESVHFVRYGTATKTTSSQSKHAHRTRPCATHPLIGKLFIVAPYLPPNSTLRRSASLPPSPMAYLALSKSGPLIVFFPVQVSASENLTPIRLIVRAIECKFYVGLNVVVYVCCIIPSQ